MITPRRTRLVRAPDLRAFRRVVARLSQDGAAEHDRPVVVVPTRAAAGQLAGVARTVTREELYQELRGRLSPAPRLLSAFERETLLYACAALHADGLPFRLRPGLVAEMLRFYDQLRRQSQTVKRFEELLQDMLGGGAADTDRGSDRMLRQSLFLSQSFHEYERRVEASGAGDEHTLRARLLGARPEPPLRQIVVSVADWIADPNGLFVADFDLLARLPGLETLDIVCTAAVLESGFHERLHGWWPGIEERSAGDICGALQPVRPTLLVPDAASPDEPWFTYRDREEELLAAARRVGGLKQEPPVALERIAVVFKRPLPYLYLAPEALGGSGIAFQSQDSLPLAAEPTAAALDLVLECPETSFTRTALVALLRSPHLSFSAGDRPVSADSVAALDRGLSAARYLGGRERLEALAAGPPDPRIFSEEAREALEAAVGIARALAPLQESASASSQIRELLAFLDAHWTPPTSSRERRARAALHDTLAGVADAQAAHHDPKWSIHDLVSAVRRWIGEQTFAPEPSGRGIQLVDDQAARYGDYSDMFLVGLIEEEWPERPERNIFYPAPLLRALGWPTERDRRAAADARFLDLVQAASERVSLSTFILEDESLVMRSTQLDEISRAKLSSTAVWSDEEPFHRDDIVATNGSGLEAGGDRPWLVLRTERTDSGAPEFHGTIGDLPARSWSVSALETYLECPFKFFARHVLRLQEEPEDEEMMDPRRQGQLVHQVFETFFREWQASGRRAITMENLDDARALFALVVDRLLAGVPPAEAGLERTRLLGSSAAAGLGEAVFRMEAERQVEVIDRLLEHRLDGEFVIETESGPRRISLRGKADRLDLLADGTFRVIDYKLGWPPNRTRALQLPVYALCAAQRLAHRDGRPWVLDEAVYLAFKGPRRVVPLFSSASARDEVLAAAAQRLSDTIDAIERGQFPPTPDDVFRCESCSFAGVCRKDYVGDV